MIVKTMGMAMKCYVYVFASTHDALVAERCWKKLDYRGKLRPVPRVLSPGCGLCLEVHLPPDADPGELARQQGFSWQDIFLFSDKEYISYKNPG